VCYQDIEAMLQGARRKRQNFHVQNMSPNCPLNLFVLIHWHMPETTTTQVIGVEPELAASYTAALKAGKPVPAPITPTLADGLAVPVVGSHAFAVAQHYVDECVLTSEKQISLAVLRLIENEKMVVEGGGACGLAALLRKFLLFDVPQWCCFLTSIRFAGNHSSSFEKFTNH